MADTFSNPTVYECIFTVMVVAIAILCGPKLAWVARMLILIYLPVALGLAIYYLGFKRTTWQAGDATTPDAERYSRAVKRSSAVYLAINLVIFAAARVFGISYNNVWYNYISLFVTTMITYVYDRAVATDDGLSHLVAQPGKTVLNAYLSICSPSFMRYLIVLGTEIPLMVIIAYYIGQLIPSYCWVANSVFRKSIVPVVVFSIVGGPMRFAWAYPTVTEGARIPYLLSYLMCFLILGTAAYFGGNLSPTSAVGVLIFLALVAFILQLGSFSNAQHISDVFTDATIMPQWAMALCATLILLSVLAIAYRFFADFLQPYLLLTCEGTQKALAEKRRHPCCRSRRFCL